MKRKSIVIALANSYLRKQSSTSIRLLRKFGLVRKLEFNELPRNIEATLATRRTLPNLFRF